MRRQWYALLGVIMAKKKTKRRSRKKVGSKVKKLGKVRAMQVGAKANIWSVQNALRKDGYFARAVGPNKIATNAPVKAIG